MKVKVCGLARLDDLGVVAAARPDAVGLVLADSKRRVGVETAARLLAAIPSTVQTWAVFREPSRADLAAVAHLPFTGVQAWASWGGEGLPEGWAWLPVFPDGPSLLEDVRAAGFDGRPRDVVGLVGAFLVDGPGGGGGGAAGDLQRAAAAARLGPMVLAGGLHAGNVAAAVRVVAPYGVDAASGTEVAPGVKDPARVAGFVAGARAAARGAGEGTAEGTA